MNDMVQHLMRDIAAQFYRELVEVLEEADNKVNEVWSSISNFESLEGLDDILISEFLLPMEFVERQQNFLKIERLLFILEALKRPELGGMRGLTPLMNPRGFEGLIHEILSKSGYHVSKNFIFFDESDMVRKTKQEKYEIDVIAYGKPYLLFIDAKQWKKKDKYSALNRAANLQLQRVRALIKNPSPFSSLLRDKLGIKTHLIPSKLSLIPMMVTLEENRFRVNDSYVPLVSISKLNGFLNEFMDNLEYVSVFPWEGTIEA